MRIPGAALPQTVQIRTHSSYAVAERLREGTSRNVRPAMQAVTSGRFGHAEHGAVEQFRAARANRPVSPNAAITAASNALCRFRSSFQAPTGASICCFRRWLRYREHRAARWLKQASVVGARCCAHRDLHHTSRLSPALLGSAGNFSYSRKPRFRDVWPNGWTSMRVGLPI